MSILSDEIKKILDYESDLCLDPPKVGADDCGYETDSYACTECQVAQLQALFEAQRAKDKAEIDRWREKCFNDTMSAKKSGWDDAEKFFKAECEQKVKEIKELMKKAEKEYNALRSFASRYDYSRGKCENILMLFGVLRK